MTDANVPFAMKRYGVIMKRDPNDRCEAWGTLNPGGARGPDGHYYLFPRIVAEGNYSRIGRARVLYDDAGRPCGVERLGYALEPEKGYEVNKGGGGVEDPRVTYVKPLERYVMSYTAYEPPFHPRIALAVSSDLVTWERLGPLEYADESDEYDLNECGNKDGMLFPDVVKDPEGRPALAILHRPTYAVHHHHHGGHVTPAPMHLAHQENIWISFISLEACKENLCALTHVRGHQVLMEPEAEWEALKIGGGAPPVLLPYGWLFLYHGVHGSEKGAVKHVTYAAGAAVLDLDDPRRVLYRSPQPILAPELPDEIAGIVPGVVFPTATDRRDDNRLNVYCGAADSEIEAAFLTIPEALPS